MHPGPRLLPRPLIERILDNEGLRARYLVHAERILEAYFQPAELEAKLDALFTQVGRPIPVLASMKAFMMKPYG